MRKKPNRVKRWGAVLLAVILLLGCALAGAEERTQTNAEIVEQLESREKTGSGEASGALEMLKTLGEILISEDFRSLLEYEDVKEVFNEIILETTLWLYENRPVTIKILRELGLSEKETVIVEKLWDSLDRIINSMEFYLETEDGKALQSSYTALTESNAFQRVWEDFVKLVKKEDLQDLLKTLKGSLEGQLEEARAFIDATIVEGETGEQVEEKLSRFQEKFNRIVEERGGDPQAIALTTGMQIFARVAESDWAKNSMPDLMEQEALWTFLEQLENLLNSPIMETAKQEMINLLQDEEIMDYLTELINGMVGIIREQNEIEAEKKAVTTETTNATESEATEAETTQENPS